MLSRRLNAGLDSPNIRNRQQIVDLSLDQAVKTTNAGVTPGLRHAYDVNCQYCVKLRQRIAAARCLTIPDDLEIVFLIGLFHVHGHKENCLPRFASTFSPGAGMSSGEILESLWSILNEAAYITRTMTLNHRAEMMDACIADINWKKLQGLGTLFPLCPLWRTNFLLVSALKSSLKKAVSGHTEASRYCFGLEKTASPTQRAVWNGQMEEANRKRQAGDIAAMDVYLPAHEKGPPCKSMLCNSAPSFIISP
jgi:hypothetical protein